MVTMYVAGKPVGQPADLPALLPGLIAGRQRVEFVDDAGRRLGVFTPDAPPADPNEPIIPWEPNATAEDIARRMAGPAYPFEEVKKRLGWE